ncbi:metalloregulator ArsR/SmtB family transcription factor [Psychrosphaera ytuae]|uniref:Metalloregulator ArsR/SmtB family transcription factor n=1 Tax=Psychrosphaera ytuae TaxID=2820710 RepID=A0A975DCM9_9GAMM|nr:metalloregulator ArsR/SmtB family transcription factor [Psychrosphaera ytuae]QTH64473.1 metalloregulator ArsR/SmtB family transcription factor [Psychrosphaera ytuae]
MEHNTPTLPQLFKALGDEIRLVALLLIVDQDEICVCELMTALDEDSQPKVSRHLAQLKKMGILQDRKHKQWVFYSISPRCPNWLSDLLKAQLLIQSDFLQPFKTKLLAMGERPQRTENCCI